MHALILLSFAVSLAVMLPLSSERAKSLVLAATRRPT
jgi:hypothetical protein